MDYTISNRLAASNSRLAGFESATVADEAENKKRNLYRYLPNLVTFQPVAVESLEGIAKSSFEFLRAVGKRVNEKNGAKRATLLLRQRLDFLFDVETQLAFWKQ